IRAVIQANPWALIIEDNGAGIAPEDADQLFTPFFSTKPTGQGVGLTLVREILINHGFTFSLKTDPDGWTRFRITS
ncbi:MAG: ATP-binding protein, partial [Bacteroidota bacterium]